MIDLFNVKLFSGREKKERKKEEEEEEEEIRAGKSNIYALYETQRSLVLVLSVQTYVLQSES